MDAPDRQTPTRITDPRAVAAITHPLRMRLLGELARRGPARAVDLAEVVGEPANAVSFHLRQLARYGLIEEDGERAGNRRERWWRQTSDRGFEIDLEALRAGDGGEAAVDTLRRVAEGHVVALHRAVQAERSGGSTPEGTGAAPRVISGDVALRLTDTELDELRGDVEQLLDRWVERTRAREAEASGAVAGDAGGGQGEPRRGYYGMVMAAPEDALFRSYADQGEQA